MIYLVIIRNIRMLMIGNYKIKTELAPPIMDSVLTRRNVTYNFQLESFSWKEKNDFLLSRNTLSYRAPLLWTVSGQVSNGLNFPRQTVPRRISPTYAGELSYNRYLGTFFWKSSSFTHSKMISTDWYRIQIPATVSLNLALILRSYF